MLIKWKWVLCTAVAPESPTERKSMKLAQRFDVDASPQLDSEDQDSFFLAVKLPVLATQRFFTAKFCGHAMTQMRAQSLHRARGLVLLVAICAFSGAVAAESPKDLIVAVTEGHLALERKVDGTSVLVDRRNRSGRAETLYLCVDPSEFQDAEQRHIVFIATRALLLTSLQNQLGHRVDLLEWNPGVTESPSLCVVSRSQYTKRRMAISEFNFFQHSEPFKFISPEALAAPLEEAKKVQQTQQASESAREDQLSHLAAADSRDKIFVTYMVGGMRMEPGNSGMARCTLTEYIRDPRLSGVIRYVDSEVTAVAVRSGYKGIHGGIVDHRTMDDLYRSSGGCYVVIDFAKNTRLLLDAYKKRQITLKWLEVDVPSIEARLGGFASVEQYQSARQIGVNSTEYENLLRHGIKDAKEFHDAAAEMNSAGYSKSSQYQDVIAYLDDKLQGAPDHRSALEVRTEREQKLAADERTRKLSQAAKEHGFKSGVAYELAMQIGAVNQTQIDKLANLNVGSAAAYKSVAAEARTSGYTKADRVDDVIDYLTDKKEAASANSTAIAVRAAREQRLLQQRAARDKVVTDCLKTNGYFDTENQVARNAIERKCR